MAGANKNATTVIMGSVGGNQTVPLFPYTEVKDDDKRQRNHSYDLRCRTHGRMKHVPKTRGTPYRKSPDAVRKRKAAEEDRDMKQLYNRKSSFRYWNSEYYEDTDFLASLGFYFEGRRQNEVVCYFCEKTVVLSQDDDVSKRHSELSPNCCYYLQKQ